MTYFIRINDDLLIDADSISALLVDDGQGYVALKGGHRFKMPISDLELLRKYMCSRRGYPMFDLYGNQITHYFNDEDF